MADLTFICARCGHGRNAHEAAFTGCRADACACRGYVPNGESIQQPTLPTYAGGTAQDWHDRCMEYVKHLHDAEVERDALRARVELLQSVIERHPMGCYADDVWGCVVCDHKRLEEKING